MKSKYQPLAALIILGLVTSLKSSEPKNPLAEQEEQENPAMMMAMKFGSPGANHFILEPTIGKWKCTVRTWMNPESKVEENTGTSDFSWTLEGRFVKEEFKGELDGQSFVGVGYIGYDNIQEKYQFTWMDSLSTSMRETTGTYNDATKIITFTGTFSDPMTGQKDKWIRSEFKIKRNNLTYTSFLKDDKGGEYKSMEIIYKRK